MIVDTHAHYNLEPFYPFWQTYWEDAKKAGVGISIVPGTSLETSAAAVEIASREPALFAAVGVHPHEAVHVVTNPNLLDEWRAQLETLAADKNVVAIGECGLDYSRLTNDPQKAAEEKNVQKRLFGMQIQLAKSLNKPLILHCRDAYDDLLDTLNHFSKSDGVFPTFVLHCMSGTTDYLQKALEMGAYVSFAANVTYPKAVILQELLQKTPVDRLLLETDMPYLPPQTQRGKTNLPQFIVDTVQFVADLGGVSREALEKRTEQNARTFFGITEGAV